MKRAILPAVAGAMSLAAACAGGGPCSDEVVCPEGASLTSTEAGDQLSCRTPDGTQEGTTLEFRLDGACSRGHYRSGRLEGEWETTWPDGRRVRLHFHQDRLQGAYTAWYQNGQRKVEGFYCRNLREGRWALWHRNGRLWKLGEYRVGRKAGFWKAWDESGELIYTIDYPPPERPRDCLWTPRNFVASESFLDDPRYLECAAAGMEREL